MGNELKLSFENFQSISQGELVFHTGTNVIIGQSNSGKTATFRGLKACLPPLDAAQADGKRHCRGYLQISRRKRRPERMGSPM